MPDNVYRRPNVYKIKWNVPFTLCAARGDPQWGDDPAGLVITALTSCSRCPARVSVWHRRIWCSLKPEREVPKPSGFGCAEVPSSTITAFESNVVWFNVQYALLRLGTIISIYSQKPGEILFVKRQSNRSSTVCKIQTFVLQVKYLDRNHYWVLLQQPCQRKRERGLGKKTQRR